MIEVVLRGVVCAKVGRQDVQHERRLVGALRTDEGKDLMVDHLGVDSRSYHRHKPAAGVEMEIFL